jgi:hypothetical protein
MEGTTMFIPHTSRIISRRHATELVRIRRAKAALGTRRPISPPGIRPAPRLAATG